MEKNSSNSNLFVIIYKTTMDAMPVIMCVSLSVNYMK